MLRRRFIVFACVLLAHGALLALLSLAPIERRELSDAALMVSLTMERSPHEPVPPQPISVHLVAPRPSLQDVSVVPLVLSEDGEAAAATAQAPAPPTTAPSRGDQVPTADLELQCPERKAPVYPPAARRQRQQGEVRLRIELDERGRVDSVQVVGSSGSRQLDDAARAAIQSWRCQPAQRDGRGVRAVAMQTLAFILR